MKKTILLAAVFLLSTSSFKNLEQKSKPFNTIFDEDTKLFIPEGWNAEVWAESPLFYNPTNMDTDEKGRIFVTEAVNYRNFNNDPKTKLSFEQGDRVMILEDTDNDGKADKSKVYVQDKDLVSPLGVAVLGNKVVVSCSPHLIVYTDENGDDKPDKKEILLTGFGGLDHDHALHSVVAGPDGIWNFNVGNAGPHIVKDKSGWMLRSGTIYTGGSPHNTKNQGNQKSDDGKVWVGGLQLQVNPDGTGLKVYGHNFRNSYETTVSSNYEMFQNDNDDQVMACRTSYLPENANMGYFSTDGTRYWQADRRPNQSIITAHWHQEDPGVSPIGDNAGAGSPTGMGINEGDLFGENFRGMVMSAEAGRNTIYGYFPKANNAAYELERHVLVSTLNEDNVNYKWNDNEANKDEKKWFRPSDVMVGVDGAIYIADWYDPIVGGHAMQDKKGIGRIYRLTPNNHSNKQINLDSESTSNQIEMLKNPAVNVRNEAFLKLKISKDTKAVKSLLSDPNPFVVARAVYLLAEMGQESLNEVTEMIESNNSQVAYNAFKAVKNKKKLSTALLSRLANNQNDFIKREVAIYVQNISSSEAFPIIEKIANSMKPTDRILLESIGASLAGRENEFWNYFKPKSQPNSLIYKNLLWRLHPTKAVQEIKNEVRASKELVDKHKWLTSLAFVSTKEATNEMINFTKSVDKEIKEMAIYWIDFRKGNNWVDLIDEKDLEMSESMKKMLNLQSIVKNEKQSIEIRKNAAVDMALDKDGGKMLVTMAHNNLLNNDLKAIISENIFNNPDPSVRVLATGVFWKKGMNYNTDLIAQMKGSESHGKEVFQLYCTSCHRHGENGNDIGPDMTNIHKKFDRNGLVDAIVYPSASMVFGFEPWLITTKKGQTFYGFLLSDAEKTIVLKDAGGNRNTIKKSDIKSKVQQTNSLMPEPGAFELKDQDLADLSLYLLSFN